MNTRPTSSPNLPVDSDNVTDRCEAVTVGDLLERAVGLRRVSDTPELDITLLLQQVLRKPRSFLFGWPDHRLSDTELSRFEQYYARRLAGEPLAYITGHCGFWKLDLQVNQQVLIPRPETELLVELPLELLNGNTRCNLADLGTGSGAVALALAQERPDWQLVAVDRQHAACRMAQSNCKQLCLKNVQIIQGHWCRSLANGYFDAIVSNPPYVAADDPHLQRGGVQFEPRSALVAGQQGLACITAIVNQAWNKLKGGGWLMIEHGFNQADAVRQLMQGRGYHRVETRKDLARLDRVTLAQKADGEFRYG